MEIGVYLCASGLVWLFGRAFVMRRQTRVARYAAIGCLIPLLALFSFYFLSTRLGIYGTVVTGRGQPISLWTYIDHGFIGIGLELLFVFGVFSPILVAWIMRNESTRINVQRN